VPISASAENIALVSENKRLGNAEPVGRNGTPYEITEIFLSISQKWHAVTLLW
jgi:hypothetical protein